MCNSLVSLYYACATSMDPTSFLCLWSKSMGNNARFCVRHFISWLCFFVLALIASIVDSPFRMLLILMYLISVTDRSSFATLVRVLNSCTQAIVLTPRQIDHYVSSFGDSVNQDGPIWWTGRTIVGTFFRCQHNHRSWGEESRFAKTKKCPLYLTFRKCLLSFMKKYTWCVAPPGLRCFLKPHSQLGCLLWNFEFVKEVGVKRNFVPRSLKMYKQ